MKHPLKLVFSKASYMYLWKLSELIIVIGAARFLTIQEFSQGFFPVVLAFFLMSFFSLSLQQDDQKELKRSISSLSFLSPLYGIAVALILFLLSLLIGPHLRYASVIALFLSLKKTPETYYSARNKEQRVYKYNFAAQFLSAIVFFVLVFFDFAGLSVLISYLVFSFLSMIFLWAGFPFKLSATFSREYLIKLYAAARAGFMVKAMRSLSKYLPLVIPGFLSSVYFSYIYVGFTIGYFFYVNLTLFITNLFSERFKRLSFDMFKYDTVKLFEYLSFIVLPFSLVSLVLIPQISVFVISWPGVSEILFMLILAGTIKALADISRLVFIVEPKETVIARITLVEFVFLFFSMLVLGRFFSFYGVAVAMLITTILVSAFYLLISQKFIRVNLMSKNFLYIFFSSLLAALAVGFIKEWFNIHNLLTLLLIYLVGLLVYMVLTFIFNKEFYRQFVKFVFEVLEER